MALVTGVKDVIGMLQRSKKQIGPSESVTVGFTQRYAIYVHEIKKNYRVGGWKYLETPARDHANDIAKSIANAFKRTKDLKKSLFIGGLLLQRYAQESVPVDTSALKASAFTCNTKDVDSVAQAAFTKSEGIRTKKGSSG